MNIKKIKDIVSSGLSDEIIKHQIINCLAEDENAILVILDILDTERKMKNKLIIDMNVLLSKAEIGLEDSKFNKDGFIQKEVIDFYKDNRDSKLVGHCFKNIF